jgi:hypothetical protein
VNFHSGQRRKGMDFKIASPCPMSWARMPGGDKVRSCSQCRLNVYNLTVMSREEVAALVCKTGGRLCVRVYVRDDGRAMLQDCPQASARRKFRRAVALVGVLLLGALGWLLRSSGDQDRSVHPKWVQNVLEWVDPKPRGGRIVMGVPPPLNAPTPAPKTTSATPQ